MDTTPTATHPPAHIAIIMDGNGRWAVNRGLPRIEGHRRGADAVRRTVHAAAEMGVEYLTLFGFSSENWNRPEEEVSELMRLLSYYLRSETAELHKNNIRIRIIGERSRFSKDIISLIENAEELTKDNTSLTLAIALNYGGRQDILQAAKRVAESGLRLSDEAFEMAFEESLMTVGMPDPDLMIRTSGEQRISNFLLWQCAYTEMVFCDAFWPDFDRKHLEQAIEEYSTRDRRFGTLPQNNKKL
jgi:undecaprenyl diphosphate synthase